METRNIALLYTTKPHVDKMVETARSVAKEIGLNIVTEQTAHGSLDQPLQVKRLLKDESIDGVVVLGIIRKGETLHGPVIGHAIVNALVQLQLEFMKPVALGIIGPDVTDKGLTDNDGERLKYYGGSAVRALLHTLE